MHHRVVHNIYNKHQIVLALNAHKQVKPLLTHSLMHQTQRLLLCSQEKHPYPNHNNVISPQFIKRPSCKATHRQISTMLKKQFRHSYFNAHRLELVESSKIFISQTQCHEGHTQPYHAQWCLWRNVLLLNTLTCINSYTQARYNVNFLLK